MEPLLTEASGLAPHAVDVMMRTGDVRGWSAWLNGDPAGAAAAFDRGLDRRGSPTASPTPVWGLWALLHTTLDPDPGVAAGDVRSANVDVHAGNRGAQHYVDAVTAARAGDRAGAERLIAAGDTMMAGHPAWRHILRITLAATAAAEGFGAPDAWLRAAHADLDGTAKCAFCGCAATSCVASACPCRAADAAAPRSPPGCAGSASHHGSWRCSTSSNRA